LRWLVVDHQPLIPHRILEGAERIVAVACHAVKQVDPTIPRISQVHFAILRVLSKYFSNSFAIRSISTENSINPLLLTKKQAGVYDILQVQPIHPKLQLHVQRKHQRFTVRDVLYYPRIPVIQPKEKWRFAILAEQPHIPKVTAKEAWLVLENGGRHTVTFLAMDFELA